MAGTEAESLRNDLNPIPEKVDQHGEQGAEVERDIEGKALIGPPEEPGGEGQVGAGADGEKFGDSLDQRKNNYMEQRHREQ